MSRLFSALMFAGAAFVLLALGTHQDDVTFATVTITTQR